MSLAYCKRVRIPKRYSYFSFGSRKTGAAMVEQALSHYMNQLGQPHNDLKPQAFRKAASILYYKSTRAYCFMQLQSCMVRANVWKNMLACVFNNRPDAGERLYIPSSHKEEPGKGCDGNDAICQRAIRDRASWCNRNNGLCVAAEGVTFPRMDDGYGIYDTNQANAFENFFSKIERTDNSSHYEAPYCSTDNYTVHISSDNYDNHNNYNNYDYSKHYNNYDYSKHYNNYDYSKHYNNHDNYDYPKHYNNYDNPTHYNISCSAGNKRDRKEDHG
ncbi:hypothetical protein Q1695_008196 [Nippostrongylus brasiliensis]|nr:hypothetical protein Q1695_008196 [Nippostrongylus brasiliensis]